jgi:hypothetical protein
MMNWIFFSLTMIGWIVAASLAAIAVCATANLLKRHEPEELTSDVQRLERQMADVLAQDHEAANAITRWGQEHQDYGDEGEA